MHLTPTEQRLLGFITAQTLTNGGACCTKKDLSEELHCCIRTVDRSVRTLRSEGIITVEEQHLDSGAQGANVYRVVQ